MKNFLKILKTCPLFIGIDESELEALLKCLEARVESFDKKYTVFAEGYPSKYIGIVLSGSVQVVQVDYYGNRSILSTIDAGDMFSEAFACAEVKSMPVSVIAAEPCEIMLIDCAHILHTCQNGCGFHHRLIYNLMRSLAQKTLAFHQKIDVTSQRTTREKLLTYLMHVSKKVNSRRFDIPYDRQELADYLGVERSGLSAEIGKMKKEGLIKNRKNSFELL